MNYDDIDSPVYFMFASTFGISEFKVISYHDELCDVLFKDKSTISTIAKKHLCLDPDEAMLQYYFEKINKIQDGIRYHMDEIKTKEKQIERIKKQSNYDELVVKFPERFF